MGRTNFFLLVMGVVACVAMVLMLRHVATLGTQPPAISSELDRAFPDRLREKARCRLDDRGDRVYAVVELCPKQGENLERLPQEVAALVWRRLGATPRLAYVEVWIHPADGRASRRSLVPRPASAAAAPR
ncbi:MAG: hypothetical protein IT458_14185 [Planctomycetes bacterium]|nr:hypothetical protein [Planctomycetota bacterium]